MNIYEQVLNLLWVLAGSGICLYSTGLKLAVASRPGSGLIPFLSGLTIAIVGLVQLVAAGRRRDEKSQGARFWEGPASRNRISLVLAGFFAMAFLLPQLGFLLTSIVVTSFLLYVISPRHILKVVGIALFTCLSVYLLFVVLLQVNLPKGVWGF